MFQDIDIEGLGEDAKLMAERIAGLSVAATYMPQSDLLALFFAGMDYQRALDAKQAEQGQA